MARTRQRVCLESGLKLDLNRLMRQGVIQKGARSGPFRMRWTNSHTGELTANAFLTSDMRCDYEGMLHIRMADMEQAIILTPRRRRFGGHQWYFMCPHEDRCCSVLWRPPGAKEFRCRQGWGKAVSYTSQLLDRTNRAHRGQAKIKAHLIGEHDPDEWTLPPKPKWMRWATYDCFVERFDKYEAILNEGVEELWAKLFADDPLPDE
jgi:hypothetical protein